MGADEDVAAVGVGRECEASVAGLDQLAAHELGLGCITAYHMGCYPEVLRKELGIPEHLNILLGIAIGYKDEDSCENRDKAVRTPVDEILTIVH